MNSRRVIVWRRGLKVLKIVSFAGIPGKDTLLRDIPSKNGIGGSCVNFNSVVIPVMVCIYVCMNATFSSLISWVFMIHEKSGSVEGWGIQENRFYPSSTWATLQSILWDVIASPEQTVGCPSRWYAFLIVPTHSAHNRSPFNKSTYAPGVCEWRFTWNRLNWWEFHLKLTCLDVNFTWNLLLIGGTVCTNSRLCTLLANIYSYCYLYCMCAGKVL